MFVPFVSRLETLLLVIFYHAGRFRVVVLVYIENCYSLLIVNMFAITLGSDPLPPNFINQIWGMGWKYLLQILSKDNLRHTGLLLGLGLFYSPLLIEYITQVLHHSRISSKHFLSILILRASKDSSSLYKKDLPTCCYRSQAHFLKLFNPELINWFTHDTLSVLRHGPFDFAWPSLTEHTHWGREASHPSPTS